MSSGMQIMVPGEDGKPSSIKDCDDMDVSQLRRPPGDDRIKPITECTLGEPLSADVKSLLLCVAYVSAHL